MIPKVIHYCWFGGNPLPENVKSFIQTWRKYCPDYEIKEWNENNFNIHALPYVEEAYKNRKWAFVSDVARLQALVNEGGIYMDTDVEVVRSLDSLLTDKAFLGFEGTKYIATNMMGCEAHHPFFQQFLETYSTRTFVRKDGSLDLTTNVEAISKLLQSKFGLQLNGEEQTLGDIHIYPGDCFSPYDYISGRLRKTKRTYTIHWFDKSWIKQSTLRTKIAQLYHRIIGKKME